MQFMIRAGRVMLVPWLAPGTLHTLIGRPARARVWYNTAIFRKAHALSFTIPGPCHHYNRRTRWHVHAHGHYESASADCHGESPIYGSAHGRRARPSRGMQPTQERKQGPSPARWSLGGPCHGRRVPTCDAKREDIPRIGPRHTKGPRGK